MCASRLQQHLAMSLPFRVFVLQMTMKLLIEIRESFGSKDQIRHPFLQVGFQSTKTSMR